MKIAYFSTSHFPSRAANSVHVMKMCNALASLGHEVTLFCSGKDLSAADLFANYKVEHEFELQPLRPKSGRLAKYWYAIRALWTVLHSEFDLIYGRDLVALAPISLLSKPVIFESHSPPRRMLEKILERILNLRGTFLGYVVISDALRRIYTTRYPSLPESRIFVAHDAADDPGLINGDKSSSEIHVGYVGHLYRGRGVEVILDCAKQFPTYQFHVVGGEEKDVSYWTEKGHPPNLIFHGYKPNAELHRFFCLFDILLAPYQTKVSIAGGSGNTVDWMSPLKIFEYMSYGKAIICSDLPVLKEVLVDQENSLLVDPERTEEWFSSLEKLADERLRTRLGERARQEFLEKFTWRKRAESILKFFTAKMQEEPNL